VDLVSTPHSITRDSQTLTHGSGSVERFHSVRKCVSFDDASLHTGSADSGLPDGDDVEIYSNWSSWRLSDIQELSVSDENISTNDCWVS